MTAILQSIKQQITTHLLVPGHEWAYQRHPIKQLLVTSSDLAQVGNGI